MRIAVVDDDKDVLEKIRLQLQEDTCNCQEHFFVEYFNHVEAFLLELSGRNMFDVYLLDIRMDYMDGISLAKKIREEQEDAYIVFITAYLQYAIEGYSVKAYQYIPKEELKGKLNATIKLIDVELHRKEDTYIAIETNSRYEKIFCQDIYYIYKEAKNAIFVTKQGRTQIRMTLQDVYSRLRQNEFIYIDRSYIVNIRYIKRFQKQTILMSNNEILPVSRPHVSQVKAEIGRYWRNRI